MTSDLYDDYYFRHGCGLPYERNDHWLRFFGGIAEKIVQGIGPRTALDVGCAMGFLVEGLRERGVEAQGLDISEYAIQKVREDMKPYCWVGSVLDPFPQRYDLIVCIEVLEHLPKPEAEKAVANLCQGADDVLFSSTPFDYKEATHFNLQPPDYWAEQFALQGFLRDVDFDASFILPWAVRFRRRGEPLARVVKDYERRFWLLWKENHDVRQLAVDMRNQIAEGERRLAEQAQELARLKAHLDNLINSPGWQLLQSLWPLRQRLIPLGSRRDRLARQVVQRLRALVLGRQAQE